MIRKRLSVIIPAYNEEENLENTVKSVLGIIPEYCEDYEIIIVDDGSRDKTGQIADSLSKRIKKIRVFHNRPNKGFGTTYWRGVKNARFEYCMMVWGDNAHTAQSLHKVLEKIGKFDVVIPNYTNTETRTKLRLIISKTFTFLVNFITSLSIKYYNGTTLYLTELLHKVPRKSTSFSFQAEVLVYIIKNSASFFQVDVLRRNKPDGPTSAFKIKNIIDILKSLSWLFWQFKISRLSRKLVLGFFIVTIFASIRILNYYNTFLQLDVHLYSDEAIYAMLTKRFLEGDIIHAFHPYWNSGFPLFTIPFYLIIQSWEKAQMLLSMTASVLMIYAMYFTLGRINITLGVIASFVAAFSAPLVRLTLIGGWTEPLYILLLWLAIFFCWQIVQTQKIKYYILSGIFFGLAYFTRTDTAYTILAFLLFMGSSLIFDKRKKAIELFNPLTILSAISMGLGYIWWILTVTKFLKTTTVTYQPNATFWTLFILLGFVAIFGLIFKFKNRLNLIQGIKETFPKILILFLTVFLINLPYIAVISHNLGKFTISGKYAYLVAGHPFTPERDSLTTFAQDIWSIDYPNYQSPYNDSAKVYSYYFEKIDNVLEAFPKKLNTFFGFYHSDNIFSRFESWLILLGLFLGLIQKRFLKLTAYLFIIWLVSFLGVVMFMESGQRYLAYSYPLIFTALAIAILSMGNLGTYVLRLINAKAVSRYLGVLIVLILCIVYLRENYNLNEIFNGQKISRYSDQKIIGEWIKTQDIKVIMARTEGISFYSGAKLIYMPAAPPDIIVLFAKAWGVEYLISRPVESSWPYMKIMVDPNFKHKDLTLIHSFYEGSLVWKVKLTDEEKRYNYRTGKPIAVFCRSNEWSKTDDPNLPPCPDRNY